MGRTDLTEANLTGARMSGVDFGVRTLMVKTNLTNADLRKAKLNMVDFTGANLNSASLQGADLTRAKLNHAYLNRADLSNADLANANLSNADLKGANLSGINLTAVKHFDLKNLRETVLSDAKLVSLDLRNANLIDANLSRADLSSADLANADLTNAVLTGANLRDGDLRWADLTDADLSHAILVNANLNDADLNRTNMEGADLTKATLQNTKNIKRAKKINTAKGFKHPGPESSLGAAPVPSGGKVAMTGQESKEPEAAASPGAPRPVKIWTLQIESAGLVQQPFQQVAELSAAYENISDIALNMKKLQMFAGGANNITGKPGATLGALYSVNFLPVDQALPLVIQWYDPDGKLIRTSNPQVRYMQRQVEALTLTEKMQNIYGTWTVQFFYQNRKIGEQHFEVKRGKQMEVRLSPEGAVM
jgi:uncharacterized protein YjbI with pentapeptide repeats